MVDRPLRRIVGFETDEHGDWKAILECGHGRHVRHRPPWKNRPWVLTEEGRRPFLGALLGCARCGESDESSDHKFGLGSVGSSSEP
jgi:hypothetical protein